MERKVGIGVTFKHFLCPVTGNFASDCDFVNPSPRGREFDQNSSCCTYVHTPLFVQTWYLYKIQVHVQLCVISILVSVILVTKNVYIVLNLIKIRQNKFLHFKIGKWVQMCIVPIDSVVRTKYTSKVHTLFSSQSMYYATKCNINAVWQIWNVKCDINPRCTTFDAKGNNIFNWKCNKQNVKAFDISVFYKI